MIALELTDKKDFMNKLLRSETFDHFLLQEAVISGAASYVIDGHITKGYYTGEEETELSLEGLKFLPFGLVRGNCFDLIKGKKTPVAFRFIFLLSPSNLKKTLESTGTIYTENDISGIFINLKYQNQLLTLTTGISYNIFSTDKSLDEKWDKLVIRFLAQNNIAYEEM